MKRFYVALIFVLTMLISGTAMAEPLTPAQEYWEETKVLYTDWKAMEGESQMTVSILIPEQDPLQFDIYTKASSNLETFAASAEMTVTTDQPGLVIPKIHLLVQESDIYLNTEFVEFLAGLMGQSEKVNIEEAYVMLKGDESMMEMSPQYLLDVLQFVEGMDLEFQFNMTKENGTFILHMDSDQLVDLTDAYMRYSLTNIDELMAMSGQDQMYQLSEEEKAEALAMYEEALQPMLNTVRDAIKGSFYTQETTMTDDQYLSDVELYLTTPFGEIRIVSDSTTNRLESYSPEYPDSVKVFTQEELIALLEQSLPEPQGGPGLVALLNVDDETYVHFTSLGATEGKMMMLLDADGVSYLDAEKAYELFGIEGSSSQVYVPTRALEDHGYEVVWDGQMRMIQVFETGTEL